MTKKCEEIGIEVTHDCSLECRFCSSSAGHPPQTGMEGLPLDVVGDVLDDAVSEMEASIISLSGGEPLIYEPIWRILGMVSKRELHCKLYTCGVVFDSHGNRISVLEDSWQRLLDLFPVDHITVIFNLQGHDPSKVDALMNVSGAFDLLKASIERAVDAGLNCEAHMVPMKPNYQRILEVADFAASLRLSKLSFLRFVPQGRGLENLDDLALTAEEFLELQQTLLELRRSNRKIKFRLGCPIDFQFLVDPEAKYTPCRGGNDAPLVLPNGDVHMCPAWKNLKHFCAGNVKDGGLGDIWAKALLYEMFRKFVDAPKSITGFCRDNCQYLDKCKGGCTAQRILAHSSKITTLDKCLFLSPDPLCPVANQLKA